MAFLENRYKYKQQSLYQLALNLKNYYSFSLYIKLCLGLFGLIVIYFTQKNFSSSITLETSGKITHIIRTAEELLTNKIEGITSYFHSTQYWKEQNSRLKASLLEFSIIKQENYLLKQENIDLKTLLNFSEIQTNNYITARLISVNNSLYNNSAVITAGKNQGVEFGNIVYSSQGLLGRVIEVSNNYSKILLITDINSRVPIISSISNRKGIIAGTGDASKLKLLYFPEDYQLKAGEFFLTSGDGSYYSHGLPVAKVTNDIKEQNSKIFTLMPCLELQTTNLVKIKLTEKDITFLKEKEDDDSI